MTGGQGSDTVTLVGNDNTVVGGAGPDTIGIYGNTDSLQIGSGREAATILGASDSVTAGGGLASVDLFGSTNATLIDNSGAIYSDTLTGFDNAVGDTIQLPNAAAVAFAVAHQQSMNGGTDTLVTLQDGSTILLKGVTSVNTGFFS